MKHNLYIVVNSMDDSIIQDVQQALQALIPNVGYSPYRNQESLNDCVEFYASFEADQDDFEALIPKLNEFWNMDTPWEDYGFNTKMFHPNVYYLQVND